VKSRRKTKLFTAAYPIGRRHHSTADSQWQCDNCWRCTKLFLFF